MEKVPGKQITLDEMIQDVENDLKRKQCGKETCKNKERGCCGKSKAEDSKT